MQVTSENRIGPAFRGMLAVVLGLGGVVRAQTPQTPDADRIPVVAVAQLESKGVPSDQVDVIADNLAIKLQQSGKFRVMERSQMGQILQEQNFQQSGVCDGSECAVEIGKILGIDRIVVGSVGLVGSTYSLNLRLVDVSTGEALRTTARNSKGTIDIVLTDLVPVAASDLAGVATERQAVESDTTEHRAVWPWVLGGAVVVGGGVAAALLLMGDDESSAKEEGTNPPPAAADDHLKFTW